MRIYRNVLEMVGETPMLEVTRIDTGPCRLFLKLELANPGGSIKDRIGISMIEEAEKRGDIRPGDLLVEATAGNTGIGLALAAAQKGYQLVLVLPDKMSQEKIFNLRAMGAEIVLTRSDVGKGHPEYYQDLAQSIARERGGYYINQFGNPDNPRAHELTTAPEIWQQMEHDVDAIVVGVGSSGTISGMTQFFREAAPDLEFVLADPEGSILAHYIETGEIVPGGPWLVEGIGEDFVPDICDLSMVGKAYTISDAESFSAARELLRKEGVLAGSSSGTLLSAALRYCREQTKPKRVVAFACDTGNKYLSKLYNDFWMEDQGFIKRPQHGDLRDLIGRPHEHRATITVGADDIITTAHNRLRNAGFSQLPVMEGERLVGVITEDDIIRYTFGRPPRMAEKVRNAMRTSFLKVDKATSLENLVALLHGDSYAAVTEDGGQRFLGLITRSDVLNYLRRLHQDDNHDQQD
ncbi:pyridoxal-phosphate dependent enzyme [Thioalkalivibrio sp. XN279]|uniref:pyridoxal-phosphate dependent enzyme n=1 Tax=Thioalkalivibrio sp. XN279 TaxID=2714953 RepID=UPI00140E4380|nr:pyridoxal-phosphate dependent enzyme [Thioalkalivibrio sp. XN279]NHA15020.1 pyridoxal-phosphate dependent enzyme [Thioalkalivibrio sp. XN279]